MKKLTLTLIILSGIAFTSCQKEEITEPQVSIKLKKVAIDVRDAGTWDGKTDTLTTP